MSQPDPAASLEQIQAVIRASRGDPDRFGETLRHKRIPHLSFSQVSAVEFCEQRYFLQYIQLVDPEPVPDYFVKGKLVHQLIARNYLKAARNQKIQPAAAQRYLSRQYAGPDLNHLSNAVTVHLQNLWEDCEIVAVEQPFVLVVHPDLPPCVGVIDLVLKQGSGYILVDHKTGRDFAPQDELQTAIYMHYIRETYGTVRCRFYYDQYRWVNNLARIRKPAFQRIPVTLPRGHWRAALERMHSAREKMEAIERANYGRKFGQCFMCPYRAMCW